MTRARYFIFRFGQAFGLEFKSRHASAAASEVHLLREAEEILGAFCWEKLENSEDLSVEYWNLRKLSKECVQQEGKIEEAQAILTESHDERAGQLEEIMDQTRGLVQERDALIERCDRLNAERDAVLSEARTIKRRHDGIKAKLEVLTEEGKEDNEEFNLARSELITYKKRFKQLRERRDELTQRIDGLDDEIDKFDDVIRNRRNEINDESQDGFGQIGKANRDITETKAKLGLIKQEMNELFSAIGKKIALSQKDPEYEELVQENRGLISQILLLRESVDMNRKLSGR